MQYLIFIFSLIAPLYALIFSFFESIRKHSRWLPIVSISLAFASISYTLVPQENYDLYRHYIHIDSLNGLSFASTLNRAQPGYMLFDIYAWLINSIGLPKNLFPASVVFIGYILKLLIFTDIKKKYLQKSSRLLIILAFLSCWLTINFFALTSGMRFAISTIIVIYVSYLLICENQFRYFILGCLIAFFIHPFVIAPSLIILLAKMLPSWSRLGRGFIILGLVLMFGTKLVTLGVQLIESAFSSFSFFRAGYFDAEGKFGGGYVAQKNLNGYIATVVIPRIPVFIAITYLFFRKKQFNDPLYLALCIIVVYLGLFFSYFTLHTRMVAVFLHLFGIYIIFENIKSPNRNNRIVFLVFLGSMFLYSVSNFIIGIPLLLTAKENLYKPLLFLLFGL